MVVHNDYHPLYMSVTPVYITYPRRSLSGQVKLTVGNKLHDGKIVKVVSMSSFLVSMQFSNILPALT